MPQAETPKRAAMPLAVALNGDPADAGEDDCEYFYWAMQDANFNVLAVVDSDGAFKERYEYTPYGERMIFRSRGTNQPDCRTPVLESRRWLGSYPFGICDIGHQGLYHDKEFNLIYNRARYLSPKQQRFLNRDPLGYVDGMSLYEYVGSNPVVMLDPIGLDNTGYTSIREETAKANANFQALQQEMIEVMADPTLSPEDRARRIAEIEARLNNRGGQAVTHPDRDFKISNVPAWVANKVVTGARVGYVVGRAIGNVLAEKNRRLRELPVRAVYFEMQVGLMRAKVIYTVGKTVIMATGKGATRIARWLRKNRSRRSPFKHVERYILPVAKTELECPGASPWDMDLPPLGPFTDPSVLGPHILDELLPEGSDEIIHGPIQIEDDYFKHLVPGV